MAALLGVTVAACATAGGAPDRDQIAERLESRTGQRLRPSPGEPGLPPDVRIDDGITIDEAVAIALWNNAAFQADLAELGFARADLQQAGLLRNPVLTLLFPWGPKQLEATAKWPIDAIWQRPRRVAAARASANAVAERLTSAGLALIADTKIAFIDLAAALERVRHAADNAALARRMAAIVDARFRAGDISRLEAEVAEVDAQRAEQEAARARLDAELARNHLHQRLGLAAVAAPEALQPAPLPARESACGETASIERDALAARPDLRAAELEIESAAARLGWERSRIASIVGILDANAQGKEGFELGPGLETDTGLFDRNQPAVTRASAELDRARARYTGTRQQIVRDTRDAFARLGQARDAAAAWRDRIVPSLERQAAQTERAYEAGDVAYLMVLESARRLSDGRSRELDARADAGRAIARLEQSMGRSCGQAGRE